MARRRRSPPNWDQLFETAAGQEGLFTAQQAAAAGYSPQLLLHHAQARKIARVQRGIYRVVHFPAGEHEGLVEIWLWSGQRGVFSHHTALALHGLSDVLPSRVHLTLPAAWRRRRLRIPDGVVLHHAAVAATERAWFGAVPVTSPKRTLADCAEAHLSTDLMRQAIREARTRGLVAKSDLTAVERSLVRARGKTG